MDDMRHHLSNAVEDLTSLPPRSAIPILAYMAQHYKPVVREGVLSALGYFKDHADVRDLIRDMATNDRSDTIREIAKEMLED